MWLYMFCITVEGMNCWLSQDGVDGLKLEGESCGCMFSCIIVEDMNGWLNQEGGDRLKVEGGGVAVYVLYYQIIVEDMNGWLSQYGGVGLRWKRTRVAV